MKHKTTLLNVRLHVKLLCFLFAFFCFHTLTAEEYELISPDGQLKVKLQVNAGTKYEVWHGSKQLIAPSPIALNLTTGTVIGAGTVKDIERNSVDEEITVLIGKNKTLDDTYNELVVHFNEKYDLIFRVYNEGAAYRFKTEMEEEIFIKDEDAVFNFAGNPSVYFPEVTEFNPAAANPQLNHWEKAYKVYNTIGDLKDKSLAVIPVLFSFPESTYKVGLLESDLFDYPGLYIQQNNANSVKGYWARYPETVEEPENHYSNHYPITRFDYIAKTEGTRAFPWRVIVVSSNDKDLLNNELAYKLATPLKLTDVSWIQPGKTTWEWWHKAMLTSDGKADPANGIPANGNDNLGYDLYKYYIDFAAANNIQYLTLDAGWNDGYIRRLCSYGKAKGVKIIVWTWASCVIDQPGWLSRMKAFGVAGAKIDFFNRNDQPAMKWHEQLAEEAAALEMVLLFHGCPIPTGLNRAYPNILNYEAVLGEEECFWRRGSDPDYHATFPFIRSLSGPEDYTPGSMRNKTKLQFFPVDLPNVIPSTMGTRCHELSMYVIYDQWLGFLSDAPTEYMKYPEVLDFLAAVPVVWDKTVPLDAEVGKYIVMAKQTGKDWFVGGMCNWDSKNVNVDFSFLTPGVSYEAIIIKDGTNANSYPTRTENESLTVTSDTKLDFSMAKGGGFVIRLIDKGGTGIGNVTANSNTSVYIDANQNILNVQSETSIRSVKAVNISGQVVLAEEFEQDAKKQQINIAGLNKGIYIIEVKTENNVTFSKVIY